MCLFKWAPACDIRRAGRSYRKPRATKVGAGNELQSPGGAAQTLNQKASYSL